MKYIGFDQGSEKRVLTKSDTYLRVIRTNLFGNQNLYLLSLDLRCSGRVNDPLT